MNTLEAIKSRRSIRKYKPDVAVPGEIVTQLLEAAMMAPSACNTRPWEFVVVESRDVKEQIMTAMPFTQMLRTAPLAIVVCGRPWVQENICPGFWPQDCGAAVENILLAAGELGYGSCWCGCYPPEHRVEAMQKLLDVESIPFAVVAVGEADESPEAKGFLDETRVKYL